jgi:hypothetical protein
MINIQQILKPSPLKVALTLTAPFLVGLMLTLSARAPLDLSSWGAGEVKGEWRVTVYLNGVKVYVEEFAVGGGGFSIPIPWWAPLLGVLSFLLFSKWRRGPGVPSPVL